MIWIQDTINYWWKTTEQFRFQNKTKKQKNNKLFYLDTDHEKDQEQDMKTDP